MSDLTIAGRQRIVALLADQEGDKEALADLALAALDNEPLPELPEGMSEWLMRLVRMQSEVEGTTEALRAVVGDRERLASQLAISEAARVAAEERARVMGEALRRLVHACEDAPHTDDRCPWLADPVPEDAECTCWQSHAIDDSGALAALASLPAAPADANPSLVCLACNGAPEHGGCAGCSGGECECHCRTAAPAEVARVAPAVEVRGVVVKVRPRCTELLIDDSGSGWKSRLDVGPIPGAHAGDEVGVTVIVRKEKSHA